MPEPTICNKPDYFVPDQQAVDQALARTTHLAIVAHQDDLEINCFHGIAQCYSDPEQWFTGIVLSDGAGSPRSGRYSTVTDNEMVAIRQEEQRQAAQAGRYSLAIQCGTSSSEIKAGHNEVLVGQLKEWLLAAQPKVVYLHNLADRHDTHVHTALHALTALRQLPEQQQPEYIYGVEGWGSLDWLPDDYRVRLNVDEHRELGAELIQVFESQVAGGKRYDLATSGRHLANATFDQSHTVDSCQYLSLAMNLKPLIENPSMSYCQYLSMILDRFRAGALSELDHNDSREN